MQGDIILEKEISRPVGTNMQGIRNSLSHISFVKGYVEIRLNKARVNQGKDT
jgi:hypothetical protein